MEPKVVANRGKGQVVVRTLRAHEFGVGHSSHALLSGEAPTLDTPETALDGASLPVHLVPQD
jgi:hypothetical protein